MLEFGNLDTCCCLIMSFIFSLLFTFSIPLSKPRQIVKPHAKSPVGTSFPVPADHLYRSRLD